MRANFGEPILFLLWIRPARYRANLHGSYRKRIEKALRLQRDFDLTRIEFRLGSSFSFGGWEQDLLDVLEDALDWDEEFLNL